MTPSPPQIGIAIVAYQSAPVIAACLDSLFAPQAVWPRVVITDNDSTDETVDVIRDWARRNRDRVRFAKSAIGEIDRADADLTLLRSTINGGFAYGSNAALKLLLPIVGLDLFWLVNPDCEALTDTAARFVEAARDGDFSLMGGRTVFRNHPDIVQSDGGRVSRLTGVCSSVNWGLPTVQSQMPDAESVDFIAGANCVVSRKFIERAGLMEEDYFVYYEEVDWAFRRGDLPLRQVPESIMLHHGGTVIGTGAIDRPPSPFACYFNCRNRVRFMRRFMRASLPFAYAYALARALRYALQGALPQARATLAGTFERDPPAAVRNKIAENAWPHAFAYGEV